MPSQLFSIHPLVLAFGLLSLLCMWQDIVLAWPFLKRLLTNKAGEATPATEPVSVIIAAHNEKHNLKELLPLLAKQDYPDYEVLVVDDRSEDGTAEWFHAEMADTPCLRYLRVDEVPVDTNSKKFALNTGIQAASNDLLLLTDADCRPYTSQWVATMAGFFHNGTSIVIGYSPYQKGRGLLNDFIRYETLLTAQQYIGSAWWGRPYMGVGRNLAYRRSFFLQNQGFKGIKHITGGDDDLLINRLATLNNTRVAVDRSSQMYSIPKKSWKTFFRQKRRHLSAGRHYKLADKIFTGLFAFSKIAWWVLLPLSFLICMEYRNELTYVASGFLIRMAAHLLAVTVVARVLSDKVPWYLLPLYDLIFAVYYTVTGVAALFTKRIRWI